MNAPVAPSPRALVHRGHIEVAALWFDPAPRGEAEARRRVLEAWTPGGEVLALGGGYLVRLPRPERRDCARVPGLPFTHEQGVLLALPLTPGEWGRLAPSPGSVVWRRAGELQVHALWTLVRVDVSGWLEVSDWEVVREESLSAPPPPVEGFERMEAPTRKTFGLGEPAAEAEVMRARMEGRAPLPERRPSFWQRLVGVWTALVAALSVALTSASESPRSTVPEPPPARRAPAAPPGRFGRWLSRLLARLDRWLSSPPTSPPVPRARPAVPPFSRLVQWLALSTPLGRWLGGRHESYVRRLLELFAEGQLDEALRYAIPLGREPMTEQARLALGMPGPREKLAIIPRGGGARTLLVGTERVQALLRERYRAAFQKLEREGRIEEAAFVLAELLQEVEEAVSFLERRGHPRLAAELAEGRELAPGLVVRQWMLARDVKRAVEVARRTGAFADAVPRLERTHPEEARALRLLWAEVLARAGDYPSAVDVVGPIAEARELAWTWLLRGTAAGGTAGARMLARAVVLGPERLEQVRPRVLALLDAEGPEAASARHTFAQELARDGEASAARGMFLRRTVRELLRDRADGHVSLDGKELKRLVLRAGDGVLVADLPALPPESTPRPGPVEWEFGADVGGPWSIEDAVPLGDGRLLVALGELGAWLLTREGRCVAHFDVPAFSLVLSWRGHLALAVAPRGSLRRVSRLDLSQRRAEPWCDVRADAFAAEYDGERWFIAQGDRVLALDALAEEPRALWRVDRVGGAVKWMAAGPRGLRFMSARFDSTDGLVLERWFYSAPDLVLRSRETNRPAAPGEPDEVLPLVCLGPSLEAFILRESHRRAGSLGLLGSSVMGSATPFWPPADGAWRQLLLEEAWIAALNTRETGEGVRVHVMERKGSAEPFLSVTLEGAHPGGALHPGGGELVFFDRSGWLLRFDLARRTVHRIIPRL